MTIEKPKTIHELRKMKSITIKDISKIWSRQTYYNICDWITQPTEKTIQKFCKLFWIDEKTFNKLLKNTIK